MRKLQYSLSWEGTDHEKLIVFAEEEETLIKLKEILDYFYFEKGVDLIVKDR